MIFKMHSLLKASLMTLALQLSCCPQTCFATVTTVTEFTDTTSSFQIAVAADNSNDAISVFDNNGVIEASYATNGGPWGPAVPISNNLSNKFSAEVAMDATGTAIAIWAGSASMISGTIETAYFNGVTWSAPFILDSSSAQVIGPANVAMNGLGDGLAAWSNSPNINVSFFSGGTWSPLSSIGPGPGTPFPAYSLNGDAAVIWNAASFMNVNTYNGTSWAGVFLLDNGGGDAEPSIGIDANGNAIAIWASGPDANIVTRRFNGTMWSPPQTLSTGTGNILTPQIAVAPDGTAIAIWQDSSNNVYINLFDGTSWSSPTFVASGGPISVQNPTVPTVAMDDAGNGIIGWTNSATNQLFTALLPKGGVLQTPILITTYPFFLVSLHQALSSDANTGFTVFLESPGGEGEAPGDAFGALTIYTPTPPTNIAVKVCKNKFATQTERVNIITWTPSTDPNVTVYYLTRNGFLIATIPADGPFKFYDHNRCKHQRDTYVLIAANAQGVESTPISITVH